MPPLKFILALLLAFSTGPLGTYIAYRLARSAQRPLSIEGQQQAQVWKHAVTSNSFGGRTVLEARVPTPPSEPGNWELVTVILSGFDYIFWWKAPADPGAPPAPETLKEKLDRMYAVAEERLKRQR